MRGIKRGMLAGAAGTTALNAATYLDMAVRGRPASSIPRQVVETLADRAGWSIPGEGKQSEHRIEGLGALGGIATGLGVGAVFGWLRSHGIRTGPVLGSVAIGGSAMAMTDLSMARLGVSDPRDWSASDWAADAVPHLLFGSVTHAALVSPDRSSRSSTTATRPGTLLRAVTAGLATGGRSTAGITALAMSGRGRSGVKAGAALLAGGELVVDKLPSAPSRSGSSGMVPRTSLAAASGAALARRRGQRTAVAALAGVAGAAAGSILGLWWRETGAGRFGVGPVGSAIVEDAAVAALATLAVLGT